MPPRKEPPQLKMELITTVEKELPRLANILSPADIELIQDAIQRAKAGQDTPQSQKRPIYLPKVKSLPPDLAEFVNNRPKSPGYMVLLLEHGGETHSEIAKVYYNQNSQTFMLHTAHVDFCEAKKNFYLLDSMCGILRVVRDEASVKRVEEGQDNPLGPVVRKRGRPPKSAQPGFNSDDNPKKRGRPRGSKSRSNPTSPAPVPFTHMFSEFPMYPNMEVNDPSLEAIFKQKSATNTSELTALISDLNRLVLQWGPMLPSKSQKEGKTELGEFLEACCQLNLSLVKILPDRAFEAHLEATSSASGNSSATFPWCEVARQFSTMQQELGKQGKLFMWAEVPTARVLVDTMKAAVDRKQPCPTRAVVTLQLLLHNLVEAVDPPGHPDQTAQELRNSFASEQSVVVTRALQVLEQQGLSDVMLAIIAGVMQLLINLRQLHTSSVQQNHMLCTSVLRATFALLDSTITRSQAGGAGLPAAAAFLMRILTLARASLQYPVLGKFVCVDLVIFAKALPMHQGVMTVAYLLVNGLDFCSLYQQALDRRLGLDLDQMVTKVYNILKAVIEELEGGILNNHRAQGMQQYIAMQANELRAKLISM